MQPSYFSCPARRLAAKVPCFAETVVGDIVAAIASAEPDFGVRAAALGVLLLLWQQAVVLNQHTGLVARLRVKK